LDFTKGLNFYSGPDYFPSPKKLKLFIKISIKVSVMHINIIFNTPSLERNECFLIIENINKNLKAVATQFGNIENAEIKLYDTMEDNTYNNKAALLSIKFEKESFIKYQVADNWEKIIAGVFHSIKATGAARSEGLYSMKIS
jgi:hypothetical protein